MGPELTLNGFCSGSFGQLSKYPVTNGHSGNSSTKDNQVNSIFNRMTNISEIPATIDKYTFQAILDTGASISLISVKNLDKLGVSESDITKPVSIIRAAIGTIIPILGSIWLTVTLGFLDQYVQFQVLKDSAYEMIIGTDVLSRFPYVNFNFQKSVLELGNHVVIMNEIQFLSPTQKCSVTITCNSEIPPGTSLFLEYSVSDPYASIDNIHFIPCSTFISKYQVDLLPSLVSPKNRQIFIFACNTTCATVSLRKNTILGYVCAFNPKSIALFSTIQSQKLIIPNIMTILIYQYYNKVKYKS